MRPDYQPSLTRAIRDARQDAAYTQRHVDGLAQMYGIVSPSAIRAIRDAYQRRHLQRELWYEHSRLGRDGMHNELMPFETAISHIESSTTLGEHFGAPDAPPLGVSQFEETIDDERGAGTEVELTPAPGARHALLLDTQEQQQKSVVTIAPDLQADIRPRNRKRTRVWASVLMIAGAFATGVYARDTLTPALDPIWHGTHLLTGSSSAPAAAQYAKSKPEAGRSSVQTAAHVPAAASRTASSIPLPDSYGLYAVSNGQLTRIEPLRMRVPDTRIALPGLITKPSPVALPDGRLFFIAYQRELMTNAPDKAFVRVIAQVTRVLTFAATGKPKITPVEDTWAVRAVSVDLTVAPVPDSQEMVLIRPTDPDLSLSPGRYMLVFKNQAYDFAVEGAVTDTAHCLERTDTQNGAVYTECRELP